MHGPSRVTKVILYNLSRCHVGQLEPSILQVDIARERSRHTAVGIGRRLIPPESSQNKDGMKRVQKSAYTGFETSMKPAAGFTFKFCGVLREDEFARPLMS